MTKRLAATSSAIFLSLMAGSKASALPQAPTVTDNVPPVMTVVKAYGGFGNISYGFTYNIPSPDMARCLAAANFLLKTLGAKDGVCLDTGHPENSKRLILQGGGLKMTDKGYRSQGIYFALSP